MESSRTDAWADRPGALTCLLMFGLAALSVVPAALFFVADLVRHRIEAQGRR